MKAPCIDLQKCSAFTYAHRLFPHCPHQDPLAHTATAHAEGQIPTTKEPLGGRPHVIQRSSRPDPDPRL